MNSALKPVLPQPGPQPGGQASPAKANVATVNHAVGHPQGAQNSLHHGTNNLVGQNLSHHQPVVPQPLPHAVPSMAPVPANMVQMAQNMSHHGNLSHATQNSATPSTTAAASPSKSATTSSPLSLVQGKTEAVSQPLALTRSPDKKEPDSTAQSNGQVESPKSGSNAPNTLKPQNVEPNKDKQDIAKTSPSTPKPPEKPTSAPSTPQKSETLTPVNQTEPTLPKVTTASELSEKSPVKPVEPKPAPTADVAPTQSDKKPLPESANDSQQKVQEKVPSIVPKQELSTTKDTKTESPPKVEEKKELPKIEKPPVEEEKKDEKVRPESPKKEVKVIEKEKVEESKEKIEEKKPDMKTAVKIEPKPTPKSTLKLATVTTPLRKRRQVDQTKTSDGPSPAKKHNDGDVTPDSRTKRNRTKVQLYQSPTPELTMATKLSASAGRSTPTKPNDDKLIIIYKNEYMAVRNAEGGFYVCQALQNVYKTTRKIKIRWLSQDKTADPSGETYKPDFYDTTDKECVLTTLSLSRGAGGAGSGGALLLRSGEAARASSILERALRAEQGTTSLDISEEHPDGLDLSLYTDESQLEKKSRKRNHTKSTPRPKQNNDTETAKETPSPSKKARATPKRSPKSARKPTKQITPKPTNKRISAGSTPIVANTSKVGIVQRIYRNTATAVTEKPKVIGGGRTRGKPSPSKPETPKAAAKVVTPTATPIRKGRRSTKDNKSSPIVPTPSTSTGKTTRTPRKPPAKK